MACTLVHSTKIGAAASLYGTSHNSKQRDGSGVANVVRMISNRSLQLRGGLRILAPSLSIGEGGFNSLDKFHSKIAICMSSVRSVETKIADDLDPFTDEGFEVIKLADKEARRMGHNYIGTEQILLGLIAQGTGIPAKLLKSMGICLKDARVEVEKIIGKGNGPDDKVFIYKHVLEHNKHVLAHTLNGAREHGRKIYPEHWLLALLSDDECVAVRVLKNLGADPNNIRTQVIQMIGESTEARSITSE